MKKFSKLFLWFPKETKKRNSKVLADWVKKVQFCFDLIVKHYATQQ